MIELCGGRRPAIACKSLLSRPSDGAYNARFHVNLSDSMTVPFDHEKITCVIYRSQSGGAIKTVSASSRIDDCPGTPARDYPTKVRLFLTKANLVWLVELRL